MQNCFARRAPLALFPKGGADFSDKMAAVSELPSEVVLARHRALMSKSSLDSSGLDGISSNLPPREVARKIAPFTATREKLLRHTSPTKDTD
ncbi:hypothetical protein MPC1_3860006 [Methylocella tundrae]|nr:hypothetical protein MPC1_3860006 [Methylocella tundrae]